MTVVTDSFDRADDLDLGADWTQIGSSGSFKIVSNTITPANIGTGTGEVWTSDSFADDQYSQAALSEVTGSTSSGVGTGVCVRGTTAAKTLYRAVVAGAGANNIEVTKWVAGASTSLGFLTQTFSTNDVLRVEVTGQDAAIVLKVFRNGTQIGSDVADASGSHINSGSPGVAYSSTVGDVPTLNDWEGGDLTVAEGQILRPDADTTTTGWTTTPLFSKINEAVADGTVITATAS